MIEIVYRMHSQLMASGSHVLLQVEQIRCAMLEPQRRASLGGAPGAYRRSGIRAEHRSALTKHVLL